MKILLSALVLMMVALLPVTASAQFDPLGEACQDEADTEASVCQVDGEDDPLTGPEGVITRVIYIFSYAVGAAAIIMLMFAGLKFITSNGDSSSVATARNAVLYASIGIVVFFASQLIVRFVISRL